MKAIKTLIQSLVVAIKNLNDAGSTQETAFSVVLANNQLLKAEKDIYMHITSLRRKNKELKQINQELIAILSHALPDICNALPDIPHGDKIQVLLATKSCTICEGSGWFMPTEGGRAITCPCVRATMNKIFSPTRTSKHNKNDSRISK